MLIFEEIQVLNIFSFTAEFISEETCHTYFKEERDKIGIVCKRCSHKEHYWKKEPMAL